MKLENIGFYTLCDHRAMQASSSSPLYRCELILTDLCNFKCPYCRGIRDDCKGVMPLNQAEQIIDMWIDQELKNIRFSGGEPLTYKDLDSLVKKCKSNNINRIAISSNGSFPFKRYMELLDAGVNDLSISLDACCASVGNKMSGVSGSWEKVIENIKKLSKETYLTVGMVFTEDNVEDCVNSVLFADGLGVSDIRVIPSAQYNKALNKLTNLPKEILNKYPILKYRINRLKNNQHVRGINGEQNPCWLALDDMAVAGQYHFPCIIYLREGGTPIGKICPEVRQERKEWLIKHKPWKDPICKKNCLDVCCEYNAKASKSHKIVEGKIWRNK